MIMRTIISNDKLAGWSKRYNTVINLLVAMGTFNFLGRLKQHLLAMHFLDLSSRWLLGF